MMRQCCFVTLFLLALNGSSLRADEPRADAFADPLPPGAVARLGSVRWRSANWGYNTETGIFTPDGERFITWGGGQAIEIFDVATGRKRQSLSHKYGFRHAEAVALAPDGKTLVAASAESDVRIWEIATGREINRFAAGGKFNDATRKWAHSVVAAGFLGNRPVYAQLDEPEKPTKSTRPPRWSFALPGRAGTPFVRCCLRCLVDENSAVSCPDFRAANRCPARRSSPF